MKKDSFSGRDCESFCAETMMFFQPHYEGFKRQGAPDFAVISWPRGKNLDFLGSFWSIGAILTLPWDLDSFGMVPGFAESREIHFAPSKEAKIRDFRAEMRRSRRFGALLA